MSNNILDARYAYKFLQVLTQDWRETDAFRNGLINDEGKLIRKPKTQAEKSSYNVFYKLVFNIKRILQKVPITRGKIAKYALAAIFLLKESGHVDGDEIREILEEHLGCTLHDWPLSEDSGFHPIGKYVLAHDILSPRTGDPIARAGTEVLFGDAGCAAGVMFGVDVYRVTHVNTRQDIYVTEFDLLSD